MFNDGIILIFKASLLKFTFYSLIQFISLLTSEFYFSYLVYILVSGLFLFDRYLFALLFDTIILFSYSDDEFIGPSYI